MNHDLWLRTSGGHHETIHLFCPMSEYIPCGNQQKKIIY